MRQCDARGGSLLLGGSKTIETSGGLLTTEALDGGARLGRMGQPRFDWDAIPLAYAMDTASMPVAWEALEHPAAVNVGNPHVDLLRCGL